MHPRRPRPGPRLLPAARHHLLPGLSGRSDDAATPGARRGTARGGHAAVRLSNVPSETEALAYLGNVASRFPKCRLGIRAQGSADGIVYAISYGLPRRLKDGSLSVHRRLNRYADPERHPGTA